VKWLLGGGFCAVLLSCLMVAPVGALSLKVAPLEYRTELKVGEKKKGFIDISNPTTQTVSVVTSAQAFKQVDDSGTLRFYDDEQLSAGVQLDLDSFELGPRQAVRMYFQLDGTKLPSGDVYGAVFFTIDPKLPKNGVGQTIRVGTLLSIVNGTPGSREADVAGLSIPFLVIGDTIHGSYRIKNTAREGTATGFYPEVALSSLPFGEKKTQLSTLVFAGRTRENSFSLKLPLFGFYRIKAAYGDSSKSQWIFVAHPVALIISVVLLLTLVMATKTVIRRRKGSTRAPTNTTYK